MARHARRGFVALAAACLAVALAAPWAGANSPDNTVQFIRGQGSDATYDVMQKLDFAYNNSVGCQTASSTEKPLNSTCTPTQPAGIPTTENYDHDVALSFNPVGSSNGITILDKFGQPGVSRIDYARSSRVRKTGTTEANLRFVAFARDALTWGNFRTAGPSGPDDGTSPATLITDLTKLQLQGIFITCSITTWNQINGSAPAAPINPWTIQNGSGTKASWDAYLGTGTDISNNCLPAQMKDGDLANGERIIFENDPKPIRNCATPTGSYSSPAVNTSTDTFTLGTPGTSSNKGFVENQRVIAGAGSGGTLPAPLVAGTTYFAKNVVAPAGTTPGTFQLAATSAGTAIDITTSGTAPYTFGAPSCEPATVGTTTYGGTQLAIYPMSYSTFYAWPTVGGTVEQGLGIDLGAIEGQPAFNNDTLKTVNTSFPNLRDFFNVYRKSYSSSNVAGHAYDYISEEGWICRTADFHALNPRTGANFSTEIDNVLIGTGLAPYAPHTETVNGVDIQSRCKLGT